MRDGKTPTKSGHIVNRRDVLDDGYIESRGARARALRCKNAHAHALVRRVLRRPAHAHNRPLNGCALDYTAKRSTCNKSIRRATFLAIPLTLRPSTGMFPRLRLLQRHFISFHLKECLCVVSAATIMLKVVVATFNATGKVFYEMIETGYYYRYVCIL